MKDNRDETLETLDAINANVKSGILALVAIAIQIRDGDKEQIINEEHLENAAEVLRLSAKVLKPLFYDGA
jgi:hypothetical protein